MFDRVAILIPATSRNCKYEKFYDTDLYNYTFRTFFDTYNPEYKYTFYIGFDNDDKFYNRKMIKASIVNLLNNCIHDISSLDLLVELENVINFCYTVHLTGPQGQVHNH